MSLNRVKIGDFGRVVTGKTPPTKNPEYYGGQYPFITPTDIKEGSIFVNDPDRYLTEKGATKVASSKLSANSIAYTCIASIGKIAIVKEESFTNQQINSVIVDSERADYRYVFYLLKNITQRIKAMAGGAASPIVNKSTFENIEVDALDLTEQKKVADILFTYDQLIENNTRRIQVLEKMAQAIFAEWFVNFNFPGYEKVKMVDSDTDFGEVPMGWKIGKLSDVADIVMGQSPSSDKFNNDGAGLPFHQGVTNYGFRYPTIETYSVQGTRHAQKHDILFSVRAPVGRINVADQKMVIGRGLSAIRNKHNYQSFQLYLLKHYFSSEDIIGGGAIFNSVTKKDLADFPIVIPKPDVVIEFEKIVTTIDTLIENLSTQLNRLRDARDLLAPRLVTGEIKV